MVVYEFKGVTFSKNIDVAFFKKFVSIAGTLFPETLHRLYSIRTNFAIRGAFSAFKSFLSPRTVAKIRLIGYGDEILKALKEDIDINQIPSFLGGNNTDEPEPP